MENPLSGVKVVELSTFVAAPSAARVLADLGAEVVKIEGFHGDPWRLTGKNILKTDDNENPIFDVYNMGKKSICINIKEKAGLEIVFRMLEDADVFITNVRERSLKKMGLDAEAVRQRFPRIIFAECNGYGHKGPAADDPGFDNVAFWTRSGFLQDMTIKTSDYYPVDAPTGIGDTITGEAIAAGILAALFQREKTGKGDIVSVSLYNSAIWAMTSMIVMAQEKYGRKYPHARNEISPISTQYKCADGEWFSITVLEYDRFAPVVYQLLGISEEVKALGIINYRSMMENVPSLMPLMEAAFLKKTVVEWAKIFREADIVSAPMSHFRDVMVDEQALVNGYVEEYPLQNGSTCMVTRSPIRLASQEWVPSVRAPLPGENTVSVLEGLGFTEQEIQELHKNGAVK